MSASRRAVIDVGTNSIKLLVAEIQAQNVHPVLEESRQTRLGQGFYPNQLLQPGPIAQTAKALAEFARKAAGLGVSEPRVVATSAVREARNRADLIGAIEQSSRLLVRVISGEEEAHLAFRGVASDPRFSSQSLLLLDVGGGSTEFIFGRKNEKRFAKSVSLGTVRLLELSPLTDPPSLDQLARCRTWIRSFLSKEIVPSLALALEPETPASIQFAGTGGTASILGCMEAKLTTFDRDRLEATRLSRDRLRWHVEHLWSLSAAQRHAVIGLPPNRADVILTGTAIYEAIMDTLGFEQLQISTRGLRFAVLMDDNW